MCVFFSFALPFIANVRCERPTRCLLNMLDRSLTSFKRNHRMSTCDCLWSFNCCVNKQISFLSVFFLYSELFSTSDCLVHIYSFRLNRKEVVCLERGDRMPIMPTWFSLTVAMLVFTFAIRLCYIHLVGISHGKASFVWCETNFRVGACTKLMAKLNINNINGILVLAHARPLQYGMRNLSH